jgi:hypothetical protein
MHSQSIGILPRMMSLLLEEGVLNDTSPQIRLELAISVRQLIAFDRSSPLSFLRELIQDFQIELQGMAYHSQLIS